MTTPLACCATCGYELIPKRTWNPAGKEQRDKWRRDNKRKQATATACDTCYARTTRRKSRGWPTPQDADINGDCDVCTRPMVRQIVWRSAKPKVREHWIDLGFVQRSGYDMCNGCRVAEWKCPTAAALRNGRKARNMHTEGKTIAEIAAALGIDETTARRYAQSAESPDELLDGRWGLDPVTRVQKWVAA